MAKRRRNANAERSGVIEFVISRFDIERPDRFILSPPRLTALGSALSERLISINYTFRQIYA